MSSNQDIKTPLSAEQISEEFEEEEPGLRVKRYDKVLACDLTRDQLLDKGRLLAESVQKQKDIENAAKAAASAFKDDLKDEESKAWLLRQQITEKKEDRSVTVEERVDFNRNMVSVIRMDTLEVIKERALTIEERQLSLLPKKPGKVRTSGTAQ